MAGAESTVEVLTPILAGGAVTLLSVYLGRRWERSGGRSAWLADNRLSAYLAMLDAFHDAWTEMVRIYAQTPGGAPMLDPADEEALNRVVLRADAAYQRVELLGPEDVATSANALRWTLNGPKLLLLDGNRRNTAKHAGAQAVDLPEFREVDLAITGFGTLAAGVVQRRRLRRRRARRSVLAMVDSPRAGADD